MSCGSVRERRFRTGFGPFLAVLIPVASGVFRYHPVVIRPRGSSASGGPCLGAKAAATWASGATPAFRPRRARRERSTCAGCVTNAVVVCLAHAGVAASQTASVTRQREIEVYFGWDLEESGSTGELLQELPRVLLAHRRRRRQGAVLLYPPPVELGVAAAKQPPRAATRRDLVISRSAMGRRGISRAFLSCTAPGVRITPHPNGCRPHRRVWRRLAASEHDRDPRIDRKRPRGDRTGGSLALDRTRGALRRDAHDRPEASSART